MATVTLRRGFFGTYSLVANNGRDILVQSDWDFPGVASTFGWTPCECGYTDGTVDCNHRAAIEMIAEAQEYLDEHDNKTAEDPGYFS